MDEDNHPFNDPERYPELSIAEQAALQKWIQLVMEPRKMKFSQTSYGLKHEYEADTGIYIGNGAFKGGMIVAGYQPTNIIDMNWTFAIKPRCTHTGKHALLPPHQMGRRFPLCEATDEELQQFVELIIATGRQSTIEDLKAKHEAI